MEHGHLDLSECVEKPAIGERITIVPNHACVVTNLFDSVVEMRDGAPSGRLAVDARGRVA